MANLDSIWRLQVNADELNELKSRLSDVGALRESFKNTLVREAKKMRDYARKHHEYKDRTGHLTKAIDLLNEPTDTDDGVYIDVGVKDTPIRKGEEEGYTEYDKAIWLIFGTGRRKPGPGISHLRIRVDKFWDQRGIFNTDSYFDPESENKNQGVYVFPYSTRGLIPQYNFMEDSFTHYEQEMRTNFMKCIERWANGVKR